MSAHGSARASRLLLCILPNVFSRRGAPNIKMQISPQPTFSNLNHSAALLSPICHQTQSLSRFGRRLKMVSKLTPSSTVEEVYDYFESIGLEVVADAFKSEFFNVYLLFLIVFV